MKNLKYLEVNKLIRELDFIKSDFEWKSELISSANNEFLNSVNSFLENHPHLKEVWKNRNEENDEVEENHPEEQTERDDVKNEHVIDNKFKNIYRQIVKETHPDKIGSNKLNELYSKATDAYKMGDFLPLIKISQILGLDWELDNEQVSNIEIQIETIKDRINFLETTFTYQWWSEKIESERDKIILAYIRKQILK